MYDGYVKLPSNNELNHLQVHRQLMAAVYGSDIKLPSNNELNDISQHINQKHRVS